jgi:Periplasmic binding protein
MKIRNLFLSYFPIRTKIVVFSFFFVFSINLFSQDFKKQYHKAQELFKDEKYSEAMDAFRPLSVYDKDNLYAEYALFYGALSAQHLGFSTVAQSQFIQLKKLYPQWPQINEVNYWLTKLYFDKGEYFQAMIIAKEIKDESFRASLDESKAYYLSKIDDVETLKMLMEENPADTEVERAVAKAIGKQGAASLDLPLLENILTKYNWPRDQFIIAPVNRTIFKEQYRIALLLPFMSGTLEPTPERKKNQLILDLYQGIRLAADSLKNNGMPLELLAYDTDRSVEVTKNLLATEELKSVDLIIGPFFADESKAVQEFSRANQINLIANPVSNNSDFLSDNPFAMLYQPSHETIGKKSAEMVAEKVRNKKSIVYFSDSPKDSVMAFNFIKRALELGVNVVYAEEVRKETSYQILDKLAKPTEYDEWKNPLEFTLKKDSIGSIFVASDDPLIYTKVINSVETRGDSILVVGEETWLDDSSLDYGKFERTHVAFAAPNYCPIDKSHYLTFRKKYLKKHGMLPPENATKGYELMMTLGRALKKYGVYFQDGLLVDGPFAGELTAGFWIQPTRDNGFVPFVSFANGVLMEVR